LASQIPLLLATLDDAWSWQIDQEGAENLSWSPHAPATLMDMQKPVSLPDRQQAFWIMAALLFFLVEGSKKNVSTPLRSCLCGMM